MSDTDARTGQEMDRVRAVLKQAMAWGANDLQDDFLSSDALEDVRLAMYGLIVGLRSGLYEARHLHQTYMDWSAALAARMAALAGDISRAGGRVPAEEVVVDGMAMLRLFRREFDVHVAEVEPVEDRIEMLTLAADYLCHTLQVVHGIRWEIEGAASAQRNLAVGLCVLEKHLGHLGDEVEPGDPTLLEEAWTQDFADRVNAHYVEAKEAADELRSWLGIDGLAGADKGGASGAAG